MHHALINITSAAIGIDSDSEPRVFTWVEAWGVVNASTLWGLVEVGAEVPFQLEGHLVPLQVQLLSDLVACILGVGVTIDSSR